jgi:hypothetical protein
MIGTGLSFGALFNQMLDDLRNLQPEAFLNEAGTHVCVNVRSETTGEVLTTHDIPLDRIADERPILRVMLELLEKHWITSDLATETILEICEAKGVDPWAGSHSRLKKLKAMPYREYLQTPEWRQKRKLKLEDAGYRSQRCNAEERLQVHHRT